MRDGIGPVAVRLERVGSTAVPAGKEASVADLGRARARLVSVSPARS